MSQERKMDPNAIIQRLEQMLDDIAAKNKEYENLGVERAEKEKAYNILFAQKQLTYKNKGTPVGMLKAHTLGDAAVSMAKFKLDVAEAKVNACREALRGMKESIGTLRSFLTWLRLEYESQNIPRIR